MLKVGIIGCGRIASEFDRDKRRNYVCTHAGAYSVSKDIILNSACDIDKEKLLRFSKRWNVKSTYTDFRIMLKSEALDLVSICTPTDTHYEIAKVCMDLGIKAVFCEKPLASTYRQARELLQTANNRKIIFAVNHTRRWDLLFQKVQHYIKSGHLGRINFVDGYYTAGISNTGSHLLDAIRFLVREDVEMVKVTSLLDEDSKDPTLDAVLDMSNGIRVYLHGLDVRDYLIFELDIYGTKGRLRITDSGTDIIIYYAGDSKRFSGYKQLYETRRKFKPGFKVSIRNAISDIAGCIRSKNRPRSSIEDAAAVIEIISALKASMDNRNKNITLPLAKRFHGISLTD